MTCGQDDIWISGRCSRRIVHHVSSNDLRSTRIRMVPFRDVGPVGGDE